MRKGRNPRPDRDVVVAGGGASGLWAAAAAAAAGARVLLLEKLGRPGVKLCATGGGRCNLTNASSAADFMARFGRRGRFMAPALDALDSQSLLAGLERMGVPCVMSDGFHWFPASGRARDVRDALEKRAVELGVAVAAGLPARALELRAGRVAGVRTSKGFVAAPAVVIATGGLAYPSLGASGDGYGLAESAGHDLKAPVPALVPLVAAESWVGECAGVVLDSAAASVAGPGRRARAEGAVLFTHRGLSGPAILDISGDVSEILARRGNATVRINMFPGEDPKAIAARIRSWRAERGGTAVVRLLDEMMPRKLAHALADLAGLGDAKAAAMSRAGESKLADLLCGMEIGIAATEGFDKAVITRGGVDLRGVNPETLGSRIAAGLFFAGEVLDIDGPCGGYNLQWAFSSGRLAGASAANYALQNRS